MAARGAPAVRVATVVGATAGATAAAATGAAARAEAVGAEGLVWAMGLAVAMRAATVECLEMVAGLSVVAEEA